jgi:hypothetical protein
MFATMVEAGKLERALDLVERLHLERSFDLALMIADKHSRLTDLIEDAKQRRFGTDDDLSGYDVSSPVDEIEQHERVTPDVAHGKGKRSHAIETEGMRLVRSRQG